MRYRLIFIVFFQLLWIGNSFSQKGLTDDVVSTDSIRKGIYLSFREFRKNQPGNLDTFHFLQATEKGIAKGAVPNLLIRTDPVSNLKDTIRQSIWGFSNGKNVFILQEGDSIIPSYFIKILYLGRYCFYEDRIIYSVDAGGSLIVKPMMRKEKVIPYIININNGRKFRLDDKTMQTIIKDDPDIMQDYKKEKNRKKVYLKYIRIYSEKHPEQIQ